MSTALTTTTASPATTPLQQSENSNTPSTKLPEFQMLVLGTLATFGTAVAATQSSSPIFPNELCRMITDYCGPLTPAQEVSQQYHPDFIAAIGVERLARLRVVTGATLDVDKNLPWVVDMSFPEVDVTKMPDAAVRGVSAVKNTNLGDRQTSFIAIRYTSNKSSTVQKVEFIFQDTNGIGWGQTLFGWSTRITPDDYARVRDMLDGKPIQGAPECSQTHNVPDELFVMI